MARHPHPQRNQIFNAIFHGMMPKEAAHQFNCTPEYIYRLFDLLGMRRTYITEKEYELIMEQRKNKQPIPIKT